MTIGEALALARATGVERLDAQLLIAHLLQRDRTWVLAHDDALVDAMAMRTLLERRASGEPFAYLVGEREFHGLPLRVTTDVLVPRPDTETLVAWALQRLQDLPAPTVLDLGTGSGAIALAVKHACPHAQVHAVDASAAALEVARFNGDRLGLQVHFDLGNWWSALPGLRFDLALANPPYVAPGDSHLAALRHEPLAALVPSGDSGDGLADIERIVEGAPAHLHAGAWLLLEHGATQGEAVRERLTQRGFTNIETRADLAGLPRASGGRWPG